MPLAFFPLTSGYDPIYSVDIIPILSQPGSVIWKEREIGRERYTDGEYITGIDSHINYPLTKGARSRD